MEFITTKCKMIADAESEFKIIGSNEYWLPSELTIQVLFMECYWRYIMRLRVAKTNIELDAIAAEHEREFEVLTEQFEKFRGGELEY